MPRDIEVVRELFTNRGFVLVSKTCSGKMDVLDFICSCGKTTTTTLRRVRDGLPCKECVAKAAADRPRRKITTEYVREYMAQHNCILLDEYKNIDSKMRFTCSCGKGEGFCSFYYFEKGTRCLACAADRAASTCMELYGVSNYGETEECKEQFVKWSLEKYNCENPFQNEDIKKKSKETCLEKYNVEFIMQNPEFKQKAESTLLSNYGVKVPIHSPEIKQKMENTMFERYGETNILKIPEFIEKRKQTLLLTKGVENSMQDPEVIEKNIKSAKGAKEYVLPSETIIKVRGFEDIAIDYLLTIFDETEMEFVSKNMPEVWYFFDDGKYHRYFPDIYIKSYNLIVEVKSDFTYRMDIRKNDVKRKAVEALGYKFKMLMFDAKKQLLTPFI